jgi:myxalamid-type polyketide synthase MxaE and MxaD
MDEIRSALLQELDDLDPKSPKLPFYSTVTRSTSEEPSFNAEYWMDNLREPVLFSDSMIDLLSDGFNQFIEISPHPTLLGAIQQLSHGYSSNIGLFPSSHRDQPDEEVVNRTLATLYVEGFPILWENLYQIKGRYINLPPIKWNRQRYWIDFIPNSSKNLWHLTNEDNKHASLLLGDRIDLAHDPSAVVWQTAFETNSPGFMGDHQIGGDTVFPATGYIEMALQSAKEVGLSNSIQLSDLVLKERMTIREGSTQMVQAILSSDGGGSHLFSVYSRPTLTDEWILNGSVTLTLDQQINDSVANTKTPLEEIREQSSSQMTGVKFYQLLEKHGVHYGPSFRAIQHLWSKGKESLAFLEIPPSIQSDLEAYQAHPAMLDACLQVVAATLGESFEHNLFFPIGCKSIRFFNDLNSAKWSLVTLDAGLESGKDLFKADVRIMDDKSQPIAEFIDLHLQRTSSRVRRIRPPENTWLYNLSWQEQAGSNLSDTITGLPAKKHWLIFADNKGVGDSLASQIEARGDHCHILSCNTILDSLANRTDLRLPETIEQYLSEVSSSLHGIIHLWSLSIPPPASNGSESSDLAQLLGCDSLLYLAQALAKRITGSPRLWIVTRGAQWVQSDEQNSLEQSTVLGFGKVISFELPDLKCTRIDLDPKQSNEESVSLLTNHLSIDDREDQIAFRSGIRYVLRVVPFRQRASSELDLRADSTYLITGGLGGIGIETAKWMGQRGARHLLLISRGEPSRHAMAIIDQLRQDGIEIVIAQADVSKFTQLKDVIEETGKGMPPLKGIIHAAGVLDDASIHNLRDDRIRTVLAPKVDGTWNLHNLTLNQPLDFFVLFSSAVSVLGSPGQANYAAASTYLDAMAHYRHNLGLPAISINWGPWAEVGLAAETIDKLQQQNASTQHLVKVITIDQGLQILGQLLLEETAQVMVLPFELSNLIELYPTAAGMPFLEKVGGNDRHFTRLYVRPKLNQEYVAPRNQLERKLAELWQQTLHIDQVGVRDSFFELGGDSVLGAQILGLAQKTFGIRINPQDAFKAFTIERLGEMLEAEIVSKIEDMSEKEARQRLSKKTPNES